MAHMAYGAVHNLTQGLMDMTKANLQSYLNWFVYLFRVRRDEEKWPKTARVLRHLLMSDAHYRSSR